MQKVLVTQPITADAVERLRSAGFDVVIMDGDAAPSPAALGAAASDASAIVCLLTDRIDAQLLASCPALRVVANVAVGYDNIDVAAAQARGIAVANTPGVLTDATADLAMALILGVARRIPEADDFLRAGRYTHWTLAQEPMGADVSGQTLGIVGLGKIGQAVARRAGQGFGMRVLYHSRSRLRPDEEDRLGVRWSTFGDLLAGSDFVSLHAPLNEDTHHLLDAAAFQRMKPTAFLINTSRGPLVDEAALAGAIERGEIAGAGLDVYEREPLVHPDLLRQRRHVVLLPHVGSATAATRARMAALAADAVIDVLSGRRPPNLVTPSVTAGDVHEH